MPCYKKYCDRKRSPVREVVATFSGFPFILSYSSAFNIETSIKPVVIIQMRNDINMQKLCCVISAFLDRRVTPKEPTDRPAGTDLLELKY